MFPGYWEGDTQGALGAAGGFGADSSSSLMGPLGMVGGSLISGLGSMMTNRASQKAAHKQMDFIQMMANTAHQREVSDLRAAGLNPILSATKGGAASMQGALPSLTNPLEATGAGIASSSKTKWLDEQLMKATVAGAQAEIAKKGREIRLMDDTAENVRSTTRLQDSKAMLEIPAIIDHLGAMAGAARAGEQRTRETQMPLDAATEALQRMLITVGTSQAEHYQAQIRELEQRILEMKKMMPEKQTKGEFYRSLENIFKAPGEAYDQIFGDKPLTDPKAVKIRDFFVGAGTAVGGAAKKVWGGAHRAGQGFEPTIGP